VNASPLIYLTHVGLLDVLDEPGVPVVVPDRVLAEIGVHGAADPAVIAVGAAAWIQVVPTPTIPQEVSDWGLDPGESAVLALAPHRRRGTRGR
jgi:predicted nucleic acid-binding protein